MEKKTGNRALANILRGITWVAALTFAAGAGAWEIGHPTGGKSLGSDHAPSPAMLAIGTHEMSLRHQGQQRKYLVHVPQSYNPSAPAPLVVAFHGGGGHAAFMADEKRYGLIGKAEREGFVVVFPNGYSTLRSGRFATWNAGGCCGDARDSNADDVGFVRALVAEVKRQLAIDSGRVFATGMSNGGMFAYRLACEAADIFTAVAAVAGTDGTLSCAPSRPVSILHIHAANDTHVLFNGGAGPDAFRDPAKVMDFPSVPDTVAHWAQRNRCDAVPVTVLKRNGAYCEAYSGCAAGSRVQLCVTDSGGHSWPGAEKVRRGKEDASQAINANDVMWEFFSTVAR